MKRMGTPKNKQPVFLFLSLGIVLAMGVFLGRQLAVSNAQLFGTSSPSTVTHSQKIQDIIDLIDQNYVDSIDREELLEATISNMLNKLDPHSNYISAKELQRANEQIQGEFFGVGIRFFILRDTVCVIHVVPKSPSEKAGIKAGDKILRVDDKQVAGVSIKNDEIMGQLKGKNNTKVRVEVLRDSKKVNTSIIRGSIPIHSITSAYMIDHETGFVRIDQFSVTTAQEFRQAAKKLKRQGMKKLILDLRNNAGGVMQSATLIADEFLPEQKTIVSTKGLHSKERIYYATDYGILEDVTLAVLINEGSASASEIVAGALQDNDRATIVGRRSFGKGLVQEDMKLRDKSSLRLTVARYYTPTGRSIQRPYNGNLDDYYHDQEDRYDNGEWYQPDTTKFVDSLKFATPKGKIVYGGGGIMPDIFVPLDTAGNSWFFNQLRYTMSFQAFAFDYVHTQKHQWTILHQYNSSFFVSDQLFNDFIAFSKREAQLQLSNNDLQHSKKLIQHVLKAEIARQIWLENGYYAVLNEWDKETQAALKAIKNN